MHNDIRLEPQSLLSHLIPEDGFKPVAQVLALDRQRNGSKGGFDGGYLFVPVDSAIALQGQNVNN